MYWLRATVAMSVKTLSSGLNLVTSAPPCPGVAFFRNSSNMVAMDPRLTEVLGAKVVAEVPGIIPNSARLLAAAWAASLNAPMSVKPWSVGEAGNTTPAGPAARDRNKAICQRVMVSTGENIVSVRPCAML